MEHCRQVEVMACNCLRLGFMLSLPSVVLSRDDADLVRRRCLNAHYAAGRRAGVSAKAVSGRYLVASVHGRARWLATATRSSRRVRAMSSKKR